MYSENKIRIFEEIKSQAQDLVRYSQRESVIFRPYLGSDTYDCIISDVSGGIRKKIKSQEEKDQDALKDNCNQGIYITKNGDLKIVFVQDEHILPFSLENLLFARPGLVNESSEEEFLERLSANVGYQLTPVIILSIYERPKSS